MDLQKILNDHTEFLITGDCLKRANLQYADLRGANLQYADLRRANLQYADLRGANLRGANLWGANLWRANLWGANLSEANLREADLQGAILREANLREANLFRANLPHFQICPEEGSFIAYKKLKDCIIAKLQIPAKAKRTSSLTGRKCRAEFAKVLNLSNGKKFGYSKYNINFIYKKGEIVRADKYNDDIRADCSNGIHFFITKKEAEEY